MTSAQTIEYSLGMSKPWTHLLEVELAFRNLPSNMQSLDLILPVWRTGRYVVFDFAGGVQDFSASDGAGKPLAWKKTDKTTWQIQTSGSTTVKARYLVFANEFNLRTRGLNADHAFVDPITVFMYAEPFRKLPLRLRVMPYGNWRVTTGLEAVKGERFTYHAPNYDYFIDCPIEVGTQKEFEFDVAGKKHVLMIYGEGNYDPKRMIEDMTKIVIACKEFWGSLPYERYVFMLHVTPTSSGGTEHINSTIMGARPFIFSDPNAYRNFLGLVAHEFFHTWNVKQIRPKGIHPFDFTKENYTEELWVSEGTTDYYDALLLTRLGYYTADEYLRRIADGIRDDRERPGNLRQSLTESSFDAWVKHWRSTEQAYNFQTDYYSKGANVSLLLDLEIRHRSQNKHSLDDVMRAMFERFPLSGEGFTNADFQRTAEELAGGSLQEFFASFVYGTAPLPWERVLAYAGLKLVPRENDTKPWLGLAVSEAGDRLRVTRVVAGSPAYEASVNVNDEIVAMDGYRVRAADLITRPQEMNGGTTVRLTIFRNEMLRDIEVTLRKRPVPAHTIRKIERPTPVQKAIYEQWLGTKWW